MNENTQAEVKKADRYNLTGEVANLVVRKDKNGADYITFNLLRKGKKPTHCAAFTDKAEKFTAQGFGNGSTVKVFGFYDKREFTTAENEKRSTQRFTVLWSGVPGAKKAVQADAPATETAPAAEAVEENMFA